MNVIVRVPGRVEIEHVAHAFYVEAARCDVRCDENIDLALLEPVEFLQAIRLIHVPVDFATPEAMALQALVELAHRRLAVGKDDRGFDLVVIEQPAQRLALLAALHWNLESGNVFIRRRRAADLDPLGIIEEFLRQLLDRGRHRRREKHRLPRFGQFRTDELDVGNETHVEHAVRFVYNQQFAPIQQDLAPLEQIHQAARRRNQHIDAFVQRLDLIAHLHAADQQGELEIVILAVFFEVFGDLGCQFASRCQDQRTRHQRPAAAAGHDVDHGQHETRRLARTRLGNTDDVLHHQHRRDGLALDVGRLGIAGFAYCPEQVFGKAEIGKSHVVRNCPWNMGRREIAHAQHRLAPPFAGNAVKVKKTALVALQRSPPTATRRLKWEILHFAPALDISRSRSTQSLPSSLRST